MRALATVVRWTSFKPLSVRTPLLISMHILSRTKLDMKGSHFMVPFYATFMAFSALVMFLALDLLVALILASTYADT
jgi:hypothetical protein